ncbi:MAG: threonine--tRNA ligase [archaeon]
MRIISLHCDYIRFQPLKKAISHPEEIQSKEETEIQEPLVVLTAVEKGDNKQTIKDLVSSVEKTAKEVKAKDIVLYPYAHLSSNLSSPELALSTLIETESLLRKKFKVTRAPFGYYKSFELKCKGHPLSELSKEFTTLSKPSKSQVIEETYNPKQLLREISRSKLDTSKLKDNDHRILGQKLDLFSFNETAPGMVFWHNNGLIIYNELIKYWREEHKKANYEEISTPQILDKKLWQISGHWEKYKDNIFLTEYEGRDFAIKPMNCPGGILVYKSSTKSYKDLPLRVGELGIVHRQELSGVLSGLFRVVRITQDDAHIYCTDETLDQELINVINLVDKFYKKFNLLYRIELSTRPEKRIGDDKVWDNAEKVLEQVLKKKKIEFKINKGDGAFYGPKIDFHNKDSLGREWQGATLQLDFAMPERFDLNYIGKDNKRHRPIMLHRTIYGALERFIGILLEHTNGNLPLWLSPTQVRIINFTDRNNKAVKALEEKLKEQIPNLRIDTDMTNSPVSNKVRQAELQKIPYIIVMGDKEEKSKTLAVRSRGSKPKFGIKIDSLVKEIAEKLENRN